MATRLFRLLIVDDHEPFRRFIRSTLQNRSELNIIGELSDGSAALQKTIELNPDLILLDIGLPKLNGFEAAQQIRRLSPKSKIIFVSQESSADIVQVAFSLGACGYVVKMDAARELLAAVDAVLRGEQFVGSRFASHNFSRPSDIAASDEAREDFRSKAAAALRHDEGITCRHEAGFYSDHGSFLDGFAQFIGAALMVSKAVIVVATESQRDGLLLRLQARGLDVGAAIEEGRYISLDADDTLSTFMVNGSPDPVQFLKSAGDLLARAAKTVNGKHARVAACGTGASLLWEQGNADGAIKLERLWDEIATTYKVDILCGYSLATFRGGVGSHVFETICAAHSAVRYR